MPRRYILKFFLYFFPYFAIFIYYNSNWLAGLKKLHKYFPKNLLWKNFKPYIFAILLDPREKIKMLEALNFSESIIRDIRQEFHTFFLE